MPNWELAVAVVRRLAVTLATERSPDGSPYRVRTISSSVCWLLVSLMTSL